MPALGIVAESGCRYFSELHFPERLVVGLAVSRLGNSSVTYRLGVFREPTMTSRNRSPRSATGCTSTSTRPPAAVPIPDEIRALLSTASVVTEYIAVKRSRYARQCRL